MVEAAGPHDPHPQRNRSHLIRFREARNLLAIWEPSYLFHGNKSSTAPPTKTGFAFLRHTRTFILILRVFLTFLSALQN